MRVSLSKWVKIYPMKWKFIEQNKKCNIKWTIDERKKKFTLNFFSKIKNIFYANNNLFNEWNIIIAKGNYNFFKTLNQKITIQKCIFEMKHDLYKEKCFSQTKNYWSKTKFAFFEMKCELQKTKMSLIILQHLACHILHKGTKNSDIRCFRINN